MFIELRDVIEEDIVVNPCVATITTLSHGAIDGAHYRRVSHGLAAAVRRS